MDEEQSVITYHLTCYKRNSWLFYACHCPRGVFTGRRAPPDFSRGSPRSGRPSSRGETI